LAATHAEAPSAAGAAAMSIGPFTGRLRFPAALTPASK